MSADQNKPDNSDVAHEIVSDPEFQLKQQAQKLGLIGTILGTRENAVLYVAGVILVIVLLMLGALMFFDEGMRADLAATIGAIGVATLGYIGLLLKK